MSVIQNQVEAVLSVKEIQQIGLEHIPASKEDGWLIAYSQAVAAAAVKKYRKSVEGV